MASTSHPYVHMEAMEDPEDQNKESGSAWNSRMGGVQLWKLS